MTTHDEDLMRSLLETFHTEASEHIETLNQLLLDLERLPDEKTRSTLLQQAFRAAHSLKGAARAVALSDIEILAHHMEDALKLASEDKLDLDPLTCDVLYKALDSIQAQLNGETQEVEALVNELKALQPIDTQNIDTSSNSSKAVSEEAQQTKKQQNNHRDSDETIRVSVGKLDALMAQVGELVSARISAEQRANDMHTLRRQSAKFPRLWQDIRTRLHNLNSEEEGVRNLRETLENYHEAVLQLLENVGDVDALLNQDALRLGMVSGQLQSEMRRVRMLPFQTLEALLQRTVRDAARSEEKQVSLTIKGADVELDKKVLELLKDSLLHLIRNAVGHGIERPDIREQLGKSPEGQILIEITQRGSEAQIVVSDDGQGFQLDAIQQAGKGKQSETSGHTQDDVIGLAFLPGVTTSSEVTSLSGRGIGLDVVREFVEMLQGRIRVNSELGLGSSIQITVPVSLAMTRVLLVVAGNSRYALPLATVEKIITPEERFYVEGQAMLTVDGTPMPFVSLNSILGQAEPEDEINEPIALIVGIAKQRVALLVDDVLTEQELAVKPFSKPLTRVRHLAGAALLGTGEPIVILNTTDIVKTAQGIREKSRINPIHNINREEEVVEAKHILVVDDSITTRTLEKNILQAAGYIVETATDGTVALEKLGSHSIDLVVADIEMPNMDGFTLTRHLRDSEDYKTMPIILVTSLESDEDREQGMMAGADAYIVKRGFRQTELLSLIQQFL